MGKILVKNSPSEFYLEFDLSDIFGQEVTDDVSISFGQAVIDTILERTESSRRSDGGRMKNYSDAYAESLEFIAAGKSQSNPNLELSGSMLFDMDIIEATPTSLRIGFRDDTQRAKAYNHHTGDTVPARPFFDLNQSELNSLIDEFKPMAEDSPLQLDQDTLFSAFAETPAAQEVTRRTSLLDLLSDFEVDL